jgi:hypothetical protein
MKPRNLTMPFAAVAMIGLTVAVLIRSPYPVVFLRGAGQTGVDWLQTPDGRSGWACNFPDMGLKVYLEDKQERRGEARCWLRWNRRGS